MKKFYIEYLEACLPILEVLRSKLDLEDRMRINAYKEAIHAYLSEDISYSYSLSNLFISVRNFINQDFDFMNEDKEVA